MYTVNIDCSRKIVNVEIRIKTLPAQKTFVYLGYSDFHLQFQKLGKTPHCRILNISIKLQKLSQLKLMKLNIQLFKIFHHNYSETKTFFH